MPTWQLKKIAHKGIHILIPRTMNTPGYRTKENQGCQLAGFRIEREDWIIQVYPEQGSWEKEERQKNQRRRGEDRNNWL